MTDKINLILAEEESFARRVVLRSIVKRPVKVWSQLIPGMFIFDFLRRQKELREFSEYFMFPRKLAAEAARQRAQGTERAETLTHITDRMRVWAGKRGLKDEALHGKLLELVVLLSDHFVKLMQVGGRSHSGLVRAAYGDHRSYSEYLEKLALLEKEVDEIVLALQRLPESARTRILDQEMLADELRKDEAEGVFLVDAEER
jgi:hypothetical protein